MLRAFATFQPGAQRISIPLPCPASCHRWARVNCHKWAKITCQTQRIPLLDEKRLEMVARNRSAKAKEGESVAKLLTAFVRKADEGTIGKLVIEAVIMLSARSQSDGGKVLRAAAQAYGIDTDAVPLKVKQDFAAKEKGEESHQARGKTTGKAKMIRSESRSLWTCLPAGPFFGPRPSYHPESCSRISRVPYIARPTGNDRTM